MERDGHLEQLLAIQRCITFMMVWWDLAFFGRGHKAAFVNFALYNSHPRSQEVPAFYTQQ